METPGAGHNHIHSDLSGESAETAEAIGAAIGGDSETATGGLVQRLTPAAVEAGPVIGRFTEIQAACACASGCPTCVAFTAGSLVLPFAFRSRGSQEIEE